jgi:transcriptional regulator with XRE-family HTH domain
MSKSFGSAVRLIRRKRGWTQAKLATEARLSRVHLGRIELDQMEPGPGTYSRLVGALGFVHGEDLFAAAKRP